MTAAVGVNTFVEKIIGNQYGISASNLYSFNIVSDQIKTHIGANMQQFGGDANAAIATLDLLCNEIQIPGVTYSSHEHKMAQKGMVQKIASAKVYNELDVSFFCDARSLPLKFFRAWQDYISGPVQGTQGAYTKTGVPSPKGQAPANPENVAYGYGNAKVFASRYYDDYTSDIRIRKLEKHGLGMVSGSSVTLEPDLREDFEFVLYKAYPYTVSSIPYSAGPSQLVKVTVGFFYEYSHLYQYKEPSPTTNPRPAAQPNLGLGANDLTANRSFA